MSRLAWIALVAAGGWAVQRLIRASHRNPGVTRGESYDEDCRTEECGPDGTPLSLYAG